MSFLDPAPCKVLFRRTPGGVLDVGVFLGVQDRVWAGVVRSRGVTLSVPLELIRAQLDDDDALVDLYNAEFRARGHLDEAERSAADAREECLSSPGLENARAELQLREADVLETSKALTAAGAALDRALGVADQAIRLAATPERLREGTPRGPFRGA